MPAIPDRWIQYKACGNIIEGTRFICFKVPLRKNVQAGNRDIKEVWDIPALLHKIPKLGAVIDLTNTAKYYNPGELQSAGVLHKKILMPGRILPPENKVAEFTNTVDEFLGKDGECLVGIHCTHGLNRTGYMVCRYMRDSLGIPAKDAIKKFEKARGYQIERGNYIADLLGTPPPEPDLGRDTVVKPVSNGFERNSRSLIQEDTDEEQERDRYNRFNNRRENYKGSRLCKKDYDNNRNDNNRRDRSNLRYNRSNRDSKRCDRNGSRRSSESSSNSSYDFRYDY